MQQKPYHIPSFRTSLPGSPPPPLHRQLAACLLCMHPHNPHLRPGGIRQQFKAAQPMVESILRAVKQAEGLQGPLAANIWDQGDAVGAWTGKNLACVLFPTAATLDRVGVLVTAFGWREVVLMAKHRGDQLPGCMCGLAATCGPCQCAFARGSNVGLQFTVGWVLLHGGCTAMRRALRGRVQGPARGWQEGAWVARVLPPVPRADGDVRPAAFAWKSSTLRGSGRGKHPQQQQQQQQQQ